MDNSSMNKELYIDYFCRLSDESLHQILLTVNLNGKKGNERLPLHRRISRKPINSSYFNKNDNRRNLQNNKNNNYSQKGKKVHFGTTSDLRYIQEIQEFIPSTYTPTINNYVEYDYCQGLWPTSSCSYELNPRREYISTEDVLYQNVYEAILHCSAMNNSYNNNRSQKYQNSHTSDYATWYQQIIMDRI